MDSSLVSAALASAGAALLIALILLPNAPKQPAPKPEVSKSNAITSHKRILEAVVKHAM
jgi:hypothetical protein